MVDFKYRNAFFYKNIALKQAKGKYELLLFF